MNLTTIELQSEKHPPINGAKELDEIQTLVEKHGSRMELKANWDAGTLTLGEVTFDSYTNFKNLTNFVNFALGWNGVNYFNHHPKWRMKAASELMGCAPRVLYKNFKALQYKLFVVPHIDILTKIAFRPGRICVPALKKIQANEKILREVYDDKLYNILPIVAATGKSPKQLKKEYGAVWKTLCKNSLSKNKVVVGTKAFKDYEEWGDKIDSLAIRASLPTTVLEVFSGHTDDVMLHIAKHYKGQWNPKRVKPVVSNSFRQELDKALEKNKKSVDWNTVVYIVRDTKSLGAQLNAPFDPLWTPRKMKEKHDQYAKDILTLKFSPDKLSILDNIPVKQYEHEGYVATLLDSRFLIAEEGSAMGHCVAGYAESVAAGQYLVYSVTKGGERSSTLGVSIKEGWTKKLGTGVEPNYFILNQHYGRFNKCLECEHEIDIGKLIINELNKGD